MAVNTPVFGVIVLLYLMVIFYLGWMGYKKTKDIDDYMIAGRKIHSYILALIVAVVVSLATKPPSEEHLKACYGE